MTVLLLHLLSRALFSLYFFKHFIPLLLLVLLVQCSLSCQELLWELINETNDMYLTNQGQKLKKKSTSIRINDLFQKHYFVFVLKEADLKRIKQAKIREEVQDMEASLLRAKLEASRADGISWGMGEDAIEENEVSLFVSFSFKVFGDTLLFG